MYANLQPDGTLPCDDMTPIDKVAQAMAEVLKVNMRFRSDMDVAMSALTAEVLLLMQRSSGHR